MTPKTLADAGLDLQSMLDNLYHDVNGYDLSNQGRYRMNVQGEDFTYGEISPEVMLRILQMTEAGASDAFYDLGSGTGKAVLLASLLSDCSRCVGIEMLEELHGAAERALERYISNVLPQLPLPKTYQDIHYRCGNMLTEDLSDASIVFLHSTCFSPDLMTAVTRRLEEQPTVTRVITVTKELPSQGFTYLGGEVARMAWGSATLHFYKR